MKILAEGDLFGIYPEGTRSHDGRLYRGKTGVARLALETGAPVIPIGQWGAHNLLYPYAKKPRLFPRTQITMKVGDPVPLDDLREKPRSAEVINEATDRIMTALTDLVAELRHEEPPAERFDPRRAGVRQTGDPHKVDKREQRSEGA
jgi:1-acyl-sn-glycerol-3-phosphate acyltransferase